MAEASAAWAAPSAPAPAPPVPAAAGARGGGAAVGGGGAADSDAPASGLEGVRPIPLRPLTVLELLDGAIGAVRALGVATVARASAAAGACALAGLAALWAFDSAMASAARVHPLVTTDDFGLTTVQYGQTSGAARFGTFVVSLLIPTVFSGFAATVVAGLFARPVKQYIDGGGGSDAGRPGVRAPGIARLCVIATVAALPRLSFAGLLAAVAFAAVNDPTGAYGGIFTLLILAGVPICCWLTAEFAVAAPAAVLEGLGPAAALRRGRRLVSAGRWRVLWASLLTLAVTTAVTVSLIVLQYSIYYRHGISDLIGGNPVDSSTYWWLAADIVVAALLYLLTVPFRAAVSAMLYVDRRFRREGLDIRIAWARVAKANGGGKGR